MAALDESEQLHLLSNNPVAANRRTITSSQVTIASQVTETVVHWKWPIRRIKSRRIALLLAWGFLIDCSLRLTLYGLQYPHLKLEKTKSEERYSPWLTHWSDITFNLAFAISCPVSGYIADMFFGRYKVIRTSLRLLWVTSLIGALLSIFDYVVPNADEVMYYLQLLLVITPSYVLKGAFLANVIPFGMDQIPEGSSEQVCAFISWFTWFGVGASYTVASVIGPVLYKCCSLQSSEVAIIISYLPVLFLSLGLFLDFFFRHWLVREPVSVNPLRTIYRVMKYAALHRFPEQRSAMTFWEDELPSRLDNGKTKYGGPFTTEQVEDVKTFWKVLVVILIISAFNLPLTALSDSVAHFEKNFDLFWMESRCAQAGISSTYSIYAFFTYFIPIYELVIYPCVHTSLPGIIKTAGYGAMLTIGAAVFSMTTETARQVMSHNSTIQCMFTEGPNPPKTTINHYLVGVPFNLLTGIAILVLYIVNLQFICAQAPYNMKGLLVGLSYMLQTLSSAAGTLLFLSWSEGWIPVISLTCGTWYYVTVVLVTIGLSVLLSGIIRWYKTREREETINTQRLVEDVYERYYGGESQTGERIVPYQL